MKQPKPIKGFKTLSFKEKAQRRLHLKTKDMTDKELIEFYNRRVGKGSSAFQYKVQKGGTHAITREKVAVYSAKSRRTSKTKALKKSEA